MLTKGNFLWIFSVLGFCRETEPMGYCYMCVCVCLGIHLFIMKQLWRLRSPRICYQWPSKTSAVIQSESRSEGLRTKRAYGVHPSLRRKMKWDVPAPAVRGSKKRWIPSSTFVLFRTSRDWWCLPTLEKAICFTESTDWNANFIWKHTQT